MALNELNLCLYGLPKINSLNLNLKQTGPQTTFVPWYLFFWVPKISVLGRILSNCVLYSNLLRQLPNVKNYLTLIWLSSANTMKVSPNHSYLDIVKLWNSILTIEHIFDVCDWAVGVSCHELLPEVMESVVVTGKWHQVLPLRFRKQQLPDMHLSVCYLRMQSKVKIWKQKNDSALQFSFLEQVKLPVY